MNDGLTEAVDALTRPIIDHIPQVDDEGRWLRAHTVEHDPLLQQLNDAITSAIGRGGGGGNSAGDVLNGEALYRMMQIRPEIEAWCRMVKVQVSRDMVADLRRWFDIYRHGDQETSSFHLHRLNGWAKQITDLLDPPKRLEVTQPCPVCGAHKYTDQDGNALPFPVVIEYRRETPLAATGLCRACEHVWVGERELRQLRWELDAQGGAA